MSKKIVNKKRKETVEKDTLIIEERGFQAPLPKEDGYQNE